MESPSQSSQAQLCRNGCGFYGSSKNDGMCSLCYKDNLQKKTNAGKSSPGLASINPKDVSNSKITSEGTVSSAMASLATTDKPVTPLSTCSTTSTSTDLSYSIPTATDPTKALTTVQAQTPSAGEAGTSLAEPENIPSPSKPKKNRCATCRKKLGLTGFYCRCGNYYCSLHRYSDQHSCEFDYKADAQAKIRKENPVVMGEKINKI